MGLAALRKVLNPRACEMEEFQGRTVAVDANNMMWTFVTAMARGEPPTGPDGKPVAHVIGLVNRLKFYAGYGVRSVWVFDGEHPALKDATIEARWAKIEAAREAGNAMGGTVLTHEQIEDGKEILSRLGVPWLVAPSESDPQCAQMVRDGTAWAAVTQDYDAALHGCPLTGRNVTGSRTRRPELMHLDTALEAMELTREQLVDAAILIGTDYNEGVKGVGPVKAMKLVKQEGSLHSALKKLGVDLPHVDAIRQLFLAHPVQKNVPTTFRTPDGADVRDLLATHGLSRRRADGITDALDRLHRQN